MRSKLCAYADALVTTPTLQPADRFSRKRFKQCPLVFLIKASCETERQRQRSEANGSEHLTGERSWSGTVLGTDSDINTGMAATQSNSGCWGVISAPYSRFLLHRFSCENYTVLNERMTMKHVWESMCKETSVASQTCGKLTLRWLMSYIYGAPILDVSRSHTTTQHSR